ncbi:MAG TPA: FtsX-like permease family protein, partial [Chitinophagaceae bacterium]|nr:FtsX-like permease family protein [Chitinophagaceae bacterium]
RVDTDIIFGGTELKLAVASDPMGPTLKKDYPQVEQYVRFYNSDGEKRIRKGDVYITENRVARVDSTFFDVFDTKILSGDANTALDDPNTVVITESMSKKYFGSLDAVGKTLETNENGGTPYKVTAVIADMPHNSHFNFDFLFSMDGVDYNLGNFLSNNFQTYIVLQKGVDPKEFEKNFKEIILKYVLPQAKQFMDVSSMEDFEKAGNKLSHALMPLKDIHLHSDRVAELGVNSDVQYVYIFSAVALLILLIACINFMNLSTARSARRAREVGIRKVMGTERRTVIRQFLVESTLTALIALLIGVLMAWLLMPFFNEISGKELSITSLLSGSFIFFLVLLPVIVGIVAGSYPAFYLSSFQPIKVLKGKLNVGSKKSVLRNSLVVFQFFASIFLMVGTLVVYRQLDFIRNRKIGFQKEQVLVLNATGSLRDKGDAFMNDVLALPGVKSSTWSGYLPVSGSARNSTTFSKEAVMDAGNGFNMQVWTVDEKYIPTLGMELAKGRNFSRDMPTDSSGIILNEKGAALLGYDDPLGKKVYTNDGNGATIEYTVLGVVKDFNFESMRKNIEPLSLTLGRSRWSAAFKVSTDDLTNLIGKLESKWKAVNPEIPFSYRFLEDSFNEMYNAELRVGKVALSFAVLAIVIACLGLFGLATYLAEQRTKEVGVRKVLGASVGNIVTMLSKDFLQLVLIASVIAFPVAWWAMDRWLQDFAYRINIGWVVFLVAGLAALLIAVLTVSFQAIRAALANPVKSLRTE